MPDAKPALPTTPLIELMLTRPHARAASRSRLRVTMLTMPKNGVAPYTDDNGAADQLDARDVVDRHERSRSPRPANAAPRLVDRRAIDEHEAARVEVARDIEAADADAVDDARVDRVHAGDRGERLGDRAVAEPADAIAADDGDRRGHVAERLLALVGADDDVLFGRRPPRSSSRCEARLLVGGGQRRKIVDIDGRVCVCGERAPRAALRPAQRRASANLFTPRPATRARAARCAVDRTGTART